MKIICPNCENINTIVASGCRNSASLELYCVNWSNGCNWSKTFTSEEVIIKLMDQVGVPEDYS